MLYNIFGLTEIADGLGLSHTIYGQCTKQIMVTYNNSNITAFFSESCLLKR